MVFFSGVGVNGVEDQVRVDVFLVHMDPNHRLIPRKMLLGKLCGDLQRLLRRDLPRLEGLDDVIILQPTLLAHGLLGFQHLAALPAWVAVEVGGEDLLLGFVAVLKKAPPAAGRGPHRPAGGEAASIAQMYILCACRG